MVCEGKTKKEILMGRIEVVKNWTKDKIDVYSTNLGRFVAKNVFGLFILCLLSLLINVLCIVIVYSSKEKIDTVITKPVELNNSDDLSSVKVQLNRVSEGLNQMYLVADHDYSDFKREVVKINNRLSELESVVGLLEE